MARRPFGVGTQRVPEMRHMVQRTQDPAAVREAGLKYLSAAHYQKAAEELIAEGHVKAEEFPSFATETGYRAPQTEFIDGVTFDGTKPNAYIDSFAIGLKGGEKL